MEVGGRGVDGSGGRSGVRGACAPAEMCPQTDNKYNL